MKKYLRYLESVKKRGRKFSNLPVHCLGRKRYHARRNMKHQPERTCNGCKKVLHKDDVVRIIAGPEGVIIDYREKLDGRAAYVCPNAECIKKALTKEALGRSLRVKLRPPAVKDFFGCLTTSIKGKIKSLLAISLKAGKLA